MRELLWALILGGTGGRWTPRRETLFPEFVLQDGGVLLLYPNGFYEDSNVSRDV